MTRLQGKLIVGIDQLTEHMCDQNHHILDGHQLVAYGQALRRCRLLLAPLRERLINGRQGSTRAAWALGVSSLGR